MLAQVSRAGECPFNRELDLFSPAAVTRCGQEGGSAVISQSFFAKKFQQKVFTLGWKLFGFQNELELLSR